MEDLSSKTKFMVDPRGDGSPEDYSFLQVEGMELCSVRTRSLQDWPRSAYYDSDEDCLHFISYDANGKSYLLETAFRVGRGHERREAQWTVEEIQSQISDPSSTEDIVVLMADDLQKKDDAFPPREEPSEEDLPQRVPPLDRDDVLYPVARCHGMSEDLRQKLRDIISKPGISQDQLPKGSIIDRRKSG